MKIEGANAILRFSHPGGGLVAQGGPLKDFTIAAQTRFSIRPGRKSAGQTVVVSSAAVSQPVAVRYGWASVPEGNLFKPRRPARLAVSGPTWIDQASGQSATSSSNPPCRRRWICCGA